MPVVLVTYAQPVSDDFVQSIPRLTEAQMARMNVMRTFFSKNPPVVLLLPGVLSQDGTESMSPDPQAQFICSLVGVSYASIEQWLDSALTEEGFHKPTFNLMLKRMQAKVGRDGVGLVLCSPDVASLYFRDRVEPCQMIRFKTELFDDVARMAHGETVKMPRPDNLVFDEDKTQEVTPEQKEAAMRQVRAVMAAQHSITTGGRVADIAPEGVVLSELLPELEEKIDEITRPEGKKEATFTAALWVLFALTLVGMLLIMLRSMIG